MAGAECGGQSRVMAACCASLRPGRLTKTAGRVGLEDNSLAAHQSAQGQTSHTTLGILTRFCWQVNFSGPQRALGTDPRRHRGALWVP